MDLLKLKDKFPPENIEWRIGRCGTTAKGEIWASVLAYIDNRAIQNRLDNVCGQLYWKNYFVSWQSNSQLCGISICNKDTNEWITKWDGADNSAIESTKGGLSDSMKRAAYQWGIGRYLYDLPQVYAKTSVSRVSGWKYQNKSKNCVAFCWEVPTLPAWALPNNDKKPESDDLSSKTDKKKIGTDKFLKDTNGIERYNLSKKKLFDEYQKENGLISQGQWLAIRALIISNLGGNINKFNEWLKGVYSVAFYDIRDEHLAGIIETMQSNPKIIIEFIPGL